MQSNIHPTKHIYALDYLRVLGSIMVVAIHVDTITASSSNYLGGISWWLANIIQSVSRSSVPIFILISGYLFNLKTGQSSKSVEVKILKRYIVPTMFWVFLYFLTQVFWRGQNYTIIGLGKSLLYSEVGHLYYLYIIIGLAFCIPHIWKYLQKISLTLITLSLIFFSIIEFIYFKSSSYNPFFSAPLLWISYVPYFMLGNKLRNIKISTLIPLSLIIIMTITNSVSNYYGNLLAGSDVWWMNSNGNYFFGNFSPTVAIIALSFYILLLNIITEVDSKFNKIIRNIGTYTYGIYLIHPFIIPLFDRFTDLPVHKVTHDLWLYFTVKILIIYFISYTLIYLIKISKYGRTIIGEQ